MPFPIGQLRAGLLPPILWVATASMFKNLTIWRELYLQCRADVCNIMNHPSWRIGPKGFQNHMPDSRFYQLSLECIFILERVF